MVPDRQKVWTDGRMDGRKDGRTHGRRQNYFPPTSSAHNKTPNISELASLRNLDSGSEEKISIRHFIFRSKLVSMENY